MINLPKQITDKYDISRNTFIRKDKGEVAEEREVEIGDVHSDNFQPQVKLKQWDNETNFSVRLIDDETGTPEIKTEGNKIKFLKNKTECHFYDIEKGFEFEVLLKEKPKTNKVQMSVQSKGLKFYYQPELTQEEKDEGAFRPENVIGSYAVYHESKQGDYSKKRIVDPSGKMVDDLSSLGEPTGIKVPNEILVDSGLKNYRAGKAFHIYRPKIIDNAGTEVWGELNITDNLLTVEIPQEFLDNAVYPIRHAAGLTFGHIVAGASDFAHIAKHLNDSSQMAGMAYNLSEQGNVTQMSAALHTLNSNSETIDLFFAIYREDSAGAGQHDLIASAENLEVAINGNVVFEDISFDNELLTADDYILAALGNGADVANSNEQVRIVYDSSTSHRYYLEASIYSGSYSTRKNDNPWVKEEGNTNNKISIYCTYTAGGGSDLKSVNGVALADIKSINGIAIANVKSVNGITK